MVRLRFVGGIVRAADIPKCSINPYPIETLDNNLDVVVVFLIQERSITELIIPHTILKPCKVRARHTCEHRQPRIGNVLRSSHTQPHISSVPSGSPYMRLRLLPICAIELHMEWVIKELLKPQLCNAQ
jgi:hypothetical protein